MPTSGSEFEADRRLNENLRALGRTHSPPPAPDWYPIAVGVFWGLVWYTLAALGIAGACWLFFAGLPQLWQKLVNA